MHQTYDDIKSRIQEEVSWYDQNGTPRYGKFTPKACPSIYTDQVILLRIACQQCGREFLVEMHAGWFEELNPKKLHYGDPPSHNDDCIGGDTMNCNDIEVVEVWYRGKSTDFEWKRKSELEGLIDDTEQTS